MTAHSEQVIARVDFNGKPIVRRKNNNLNGTRRIGTAALIACVWLYPMHAEAHPTGASAHHSTSVGGTAPSVRLPANKPLAPLKVRSAKPLLTISPGQFPIRAKRTGLIATPAVAGSTTLTAQGNAGTQITQNGTTYTITGGTTLNNGTDLVQSFGTFSLLNGDTADFLAGSRVKTIVARVTGGQATIDGTLTAHFSNDPSTLHSADLFLIDPAGVMFTPNASLALGGNFAVTTANSIQLADGLQVNAATSGVLTVQTNSPAGFTFTTNSAGGVTMSASVLAVSDGKIFTVVAGSINLDGAEIDAYSGRANLVAVPSAGTVNLDAANLKSDLTVPIAFSSSSGTPGSIVLVNSSFVFVDSLNLPDTGSIYLNASSLGLGADTTGLYARSIGSGAAGSINAVVRGAVIVDAGDSASNGAGFYAGSDGTASAGTINLTAGSLSLSNGGQIEAVGRDTGPAGTLNLTVNGPVTIDQGAAGISCGLFAQSNQTTGSGGPGGRINLTANSLAISNGGAIDASTSSLHPGGDINLNVAGLLQLSGTNGFASIAAETNTFVAASTFPEGGPAGSVTITAGSIQMSGACSIDADSYTTGNAGMLSIKAGSLSITDANFISAESNSSGNAGVVNLAISGPVTLAGDDSGNQSNISADSLLADAKGGAGGSVSVTAGSLSLDRSYISADTASAKAAGDVNVSVTGDLSADGRNQQAGSGITSVSNQVAIGGGNAGNVLVTVGGSLSLTGGAQLSTTTSGTGNAGNLTVNVAGQLTVDDKSQGQFTSLQSNTLANYSQAGNAGSVTVTAGSLQVLNGGRITSGTKGGGQGGTVSVNVTGQVTLDGSQFPAQLTGIATDSDAGTTGAAGSINLTAGALSLLGGAQVSSSTAGSGAAGTIAINVAGLLSIDDSGKNTATSIQSSTFQTNLTGGRAGDITISTGSLSLLSGGRIGSVTQGGGAGGNIVVNVAGLANLDSSISPGEFTGISSGSDTGGLGRAGNVTVNAGSLQLTGGAQIDSSTVTPGDAGDVNVAVSGALTIDDKGLNAGTSIDSNTFASGNGGIVTVTAGSLSLVHGGTIDASTSGEGAGGAVSVNVAGPLVIDSSQSNGGQSAITTNVNPGSTGAGGNAMVTADSLTIVNGGEIAAATFAAGGGGSVSLKVANSITIDGGSSKAFTGISADANPGSIGSGGDITVTAGTLKLSNGAQIAADTFGPGKGGSITLTTTGATTIDGGGLAGLFTGISADCSAGGSGNGGSLILSVGSLSLINGGEITASTFGSGTGGNVTVVSQSSIALNETVDVGNLTGITANSNAGATGAGGTLSLTAAVLSITGGAVLSTSTNGVAAAGNIQLNVGRISIGSAIDVQNPPGIYSNSYADIGGPAGDIHITGKSISLDTGGTISTITRGSGNGGSINLAVNTLSISGENTPGNFSSITSSATGSGSAGTITAAVGGNLDITGNALLASLSEGPAPAGSVSVSAGSIALSNHGSISVSATSAGQNGGDITLDSHSNIRLTNLAEVTAAATGTGGNIHIAAPNLIYLSDSSITARSGGAGGSITIDPALVILTDGSVINGLSGSQPKPVIVAAGGFLVSTDSQILTVVPRFQVDDTVASTVGRLPGGISGTSVQLADHCGVNFANDNISSFLITGRGGTPVSPNGWQPDFDLSNGSGR